MARIELKNKTHITIAGKRIKVKHHKTKGVILLGHGIGQKNPLDKKHKSE